MGRDARVDDPCERAPRAPSGEAGHTRDILLGARAEHERGERRALVLLREEREDADRVRLRRHGVFATIRVKR